jgi:membrane associated rhomboid family serine protease/TPR repeat protein
MRKPPKWTELSKYPVTAGTALLAIGVTVAWWAQMDVSPLVEGAMIRRGELWRLLTSIFPHVGAMHLIFNIYWLWVFGTLVEQVYGHFKTAALFILLAVIPNTLEYAFSSGGVGLSGVGYGLFGLLWVLSRRDERFRDAIDPQTIRLFLVWFVFCIVATLTNFMRVGNIAHGSGAVVGILTAFAVTIPERRTMIAGALGAIFCFGLWAATFGRTTVNFSQEAGYDECKLGYDALQGNRDKDAARWFSEAVKYRSTPPGCWYNLGVAQQRVGNLPLALSAYRRAAELGDANAQFALGMMYENGYGLPKDTALALQWYRKAADQGSAEALNNVAWTLATSADPAIRHPVAALAYARKAVAASKDRPKPHILDTLAEAYFVNGDFDDAVKTEQQAIALVSGSGKDGYLKQLAKYQDAVHGPKIDVRSK